MTIKVTIICDENPPGTAVRIEHQTALEDGTAAYTTLAQIGGGESWTGHLWHGQNIRVCELAAAPTEEDRHDAEPGEPVDN